MYTLEWQGQEVAILGFGREGQAAADYALAQGAAVTICDENEGIAREDDYEAWKGRSVRWRLGPSYLQDLEKFAIIIRSPGIPLSLPSLQRAREAGVMITSGTKLFFEHCPCPIIGVTGTKGKGTTATLIANMLVESRKKVLLVGNIGVPALTVLNQLTSKHLVVFELSSFQLQDLDRSPYIAVVLGITPDHLNYHKDMAEYSGAKANIIAHQSPDDIAVLTKDYPTTISLWKDRKGKMLEISTKEPVAEGSYLEHHHVMRRLNGKTDRVCNTNEVRLKGVFNLENVTAAVAAASVAGASLAAIRRVIKTFSGLPHRLEFVADIDGVEYWNSSYSVTPEACFAAIGAFTEPIVLLLGGSDRKQSYESLAKDIATSTVTTIVGIGLTAPRAYEAISQAAETLGTTPPAYIDGGETMPEMVATAHRLAKAGSIVLLAPGAPSFDRFANYTVRGDQFRAEVKKILAQ